MTIAATFRERLRATGRLPFQSQSILTVAMDEHSVHCMTEDMLDEWFRSLSAAEKADIFDAHLGAPDLPSAADSVFERPGSGASGIVALNAVTVGIPALGTSALDEVQPDHARRLDPRATLRTQLRESLAQLSQANASTPHLAIVARPTVEVLR